MKAAAEAIEVENMLVETDAPYMSPIKGRRNTPCNVRVAIAEVAKLKGLEFEEVERVTEKNAVRFFGLKL